MLLRLRTHAAAAKMDNHHTTPHLPTLQSTVRDANDTGLRLLSTCLAADQLDMSYV